MPIIDKFRKVFATVTTRRGDPWLERVPAFIGKTQSGPVETGTPGMIWVRDYYGQKIQVLNNVAPARPNILVMIGRRKDQMNLWQVISNREVWSVPSSGNLAHHHEQHEFMQPDMVMLDRRQIIQLSVLVNDADAFTVQVFGADVDLANGPVKIASQVRDLSPYLVTTGATFVNIETDDDGVLTEHVGDNFASPLIASVANYPIPDPGKTRIATILLFEGQQSLLNEHIRVPMPLAVNAKSSGFQIGEAVADTPLDDDLFGFWDVVDEELKSIAYQDLLSGLFGDTEHLSLSYNVTTHKLDITMANILTDDDNEILFDDDGNILYEF